MGIDRLFFLSSTSTWSARIIPKLDHPFARLAPTLLLGNHIALLAKACINFDEDRWKVFRRFEVTPCIGLIKNTQLCPILAYKGGKGRRRFKEAILDQTRVINFVEKDIAEMFPKLEFDVEDTPADNIIKLMFVKKSWKWTLEHWEVTGTRVNTKPAVVIPKKKKCSEGRQCKTSEESS
uniref:Uncharacterized protein n=1 Tax=Brassica campestris TaxID=3711 RepID=A0A3P5YUE5_BRACM|nr:unnamed protein product [Brassica rapa]